MADLKISKIGIVRNFFNLNFYENRFEHSLK